MTRSTLKIHPLEQLTPTETILPNQLNSKGAFILKLYVAYVRPILECISVAWNPIGIGLESDLEKVQQTFIKRLCDSKSMDYESSLKHLKLEKLSSRRRRVDLEMVYKALHGVLAINQR